MIGIERSLRDKHLGREDRNMWKPPKLDIQVSIDNGPILLSEAPFFYDDLMIDTEDYIKPKLVVARVRQRLTTMDIVV